MERLLEFLRLRARPWHVAVALAWFALASLLLLGVGPYRRFVSETGRASLETVWLYSPAVGLEYLRALGDAGRERFEWWLGWDLLYPFFYAPALAVALSVALYRATGREWVFRTALLVPLASGVLDWIEDAALIALLRSWPAVSEPWAVTASIATALKMTLVWSSMLALAPALIAWAVITSRGRAVSPPRAGSAPSGGAGRGS